MDGVDIRDTPHALAFRGIDYDTGTNYAPGWDSRPDWSEAVLREQLAIIRDELHCNAVTVFGSRPDRLEAGATAAVEAGLHVWLQPRLVDADPAETLDHLGRVASAAESLRATGAPVSLNVGCELSLLTQSIVPGSDYAQRARALARMWPVLSVFNRRLRRLLDRSAAVARDRFDGEITYGAGTWEDVDWSRFDAIGLNHDNDRPDQAGWEDALWQAHAQGKPVLVTEFGCSDDLGELLDAFTAAEVTGAFVFEFAEPAHPRADDPRPGPDVASSGVLAVEQDETSEGPRYRYRPTAGFHEIARRFAPAG